MKTKIYRADLYGLRESKYQYLSENDVSSTQWQEVNARTPFYLFVGQDQDVRDEYEKGWRITDIMPVNSMGITSGNDSHFVDFSSDILHKRFKNKNLVVEIDYRVFDKRWLYYNSEELARTRYDFMQNLMHKETNIALATLRRPRNELVDNYFVTNRPTDKCIISTLDNAQIFILYIYPDTTSNDLFSQATNNPGGRRPNLSEKFIGEVSGLLELSFANDGRGDLQKTFGPEDVFYYIYAVFHSPTYRERYVEFLKIDFPRVPLTKNLELFRELVALGEKLVKLHLMETRGKTISRFLGSGDNLVDKPRFEDSKVYINKTQYFEGVPVEVWNFYVGGYQVCEKWLKDRKGRTLSFDDIRHYNAVVSNLHETIMLMGQIDEAINKQGGFPLA